MTIANDGNLLRVEQSLGRGINFEGLTLLAQLLAKGIFTTVDDLLDGILEPVVLLWEEGVVGIGPAEGIIQQIVVGVRSFSNCGGDGLGKRLSARLSVETSLGFGGILSSGDDAMEPVGDANESTAIVGDIDN